jgi:hypothetical protein
MADIICKVPNCGFKVDTSTACIDVTSLMGLRIMVEKKLEGMDDTSADINEHKAHLATINRYLQQYIPNNASLETDFIKFKQARQAGATPIVKHLYLQCTNPKPNPDGQHRGDYDVTCEAIDRYVD